MNGLEFTFEAPAWEAILNSLEQGSQLPASQFLTLMEESSEEEVEDAFSLLNERDILLDISSLPADFGAGETALRLRREQQLVAEGALLAKLEESDPLRLYLEEVDTIRRGVDRQRLLSQLRAGDGNVVPQLVNSLLDLVIELSYEFVGHGVLLLDLIQEGSLGLWQSLSEQLPADFESFCRRRIAMAMSRAVVMQAIQSGVGRKLRQAMEDYRDVDRKLLAELGRNPTVAEIAEGMHKDLEETYRIKEMLDAAQLLAAFTPEPVEEEENMAVEDTAYFQMRQRIAELMSALSQEDAKILSLLFGLDGKQPMSPADVGKLVGMTPEEVEQRQMHALALLRNNTEK